MSYHWQEFFYRFLSLLLAHFFLFLIIEVYPESFLPWWEEKEMDLGLNLLIIIEIAFPFLLYQGWAFITPGLYRSESKEVENGYFLVLIYLFLFTIIALWILYPAIQTLGISGDGQILIYNSQRFLFFFLLFLIIGSGVSNNFGIIWSIPIWALLIFLWSSSGWDSLSDFLFSYILLIVLWELSVFWKS